MIAGLVLAIAATVALNVNLSFQKSNDISALALANIEALANGEYNAQNCPGGFCNWTDSFGNSCSACCPTGKDPVCGTFGCECRS